MGSLEGARRNGFLRAGRGSSPRERLVLCESRRGCTHRPGRIYVPHASPHRVVPTGTSLPHIHRAHANRLPAKKLSSDINIMRSYIVTHPAPSTHPDTLLQCCFSRRSTDAIAIPIAITNVITIARAVQFTKSQPCTQQQSQ